MMMMMKEKIKIKIKIKKEVNKVECDEFVVELTFICVNHILIRYVLFSLSDFPMLMFCRLLCYHVG
jgi:hypothetical protein